MSNYYSTEIHNLASELVLAYQSSKSLYYNVGIDDISEDDQSELASLFLEKDGHDLSFFIDSSKNEDLSVAIVMMMRKDTENNKKHLLETLKSAMIVYYKNRIEEALSHACDCLNIDLPSYRRHKDNGEFYLGGRL